MFIHKWNEPHLPLLPSRRTSPDFGRYSFSVPLRGWVGPSGWLQPRGGLPTHRQSPILVLTGPGVKQLRLSRPMCYHWAKPPLLLLGFPTPAEIKLCIKSMQHKYNTNQWDGNRCLLCWLERLRPACHRNWRRWGQHGPELLPAMSAAMYRQNFDQRPFWTSPPQVHALQLQTPITHNQPVCGHSKASNTMINPKLL